jgi:outer membrane autotransporter protein
VTLQPAIEAGGELALHDGTLLRPFLRLGVTRYLAGNDGKVTATMMGAPEGAGSFSVTNRADRTYAEVALGVDLLTRGGATVRVDYAGQFSRSSSSNAAWVKFSMPF